jgi:hypothetical protein
MRSVLNITITQMVRREADFGNHTSDNTCPASDGGGKAARDGFDWSEELQGTILGCFFYGYVSSELNQNFYNKNFILKSHNEGIDSRAWWNTLYKIWWEIYT